MTTTVRQPAVAGMFYPGSPDGLREALRESFAAAHPPAPGAAVPKALIVPHAGYVYSGAVAASAYLRLAPARGRIRRVVLLGPSHRVPLDGMAVPRAAAFATPLGIVPIDTAGADLPADDWPHAAEHSLEVQLPFLQTVLDDFTLLPIAVGWCEADDVADVLDRVWGGAETVVVVSTDLSHYRRYDDAVAIDRSTVAAIAAADAATVKDTDACGAYALRGLLTAARRKQLPIEVLDVRNSGDTAGDKERVVGYGAFALG
jgi:AmmeMemoRadiSam system protein B